MTTGMYIQIRQYLRELIRGTEWEGHVFAVGGCCRDELMGQPIKDVDMAVNLPCGGIRFAEWLFESGYAISDPVTFPMYGTAMLRLQEFPEDEIELVQTRKEKYSDHSRRNPEIVFGSLEEDCRRCDLTINSLYYDISHEQFFDITGHGVADIRNHIIRTPTDPDNGMEFRNHKAIAKALGCTVYFADPYCSGQKGAVENANKIFREFFPKGTVFRMITQEQLNKVQYQINERSRKKLGFSTPKIEFIKRIE